MCTLHKSGPIFHHQSFYTEFTLHNFSPDFQSPTRFCEITYKRLKKEAYLCSFSSMWQSHCVSYQIHNLIELQTRHRDPWNICQAKYPAQAHWKSVYIFVQRKKRSCPRYISLQVLEDKYIFLQICYLSLNTSLKYEFK